MTTKLAILNGKVKDYRSYSTTLVVKNGNDTLTADEIQSNTFIQVDADATLTFPTAEDLITAKEGSPYKVGDIIRKTFYAANGATISFKAPSGHFMVNVNGGTLAGYIGIGMTILIRFTNVTQGAESWEAYIAKGNSKFGAVY